MLVINSSIFMSIYEIQQVVIFVLVCVKLSESWPKSRIIIRKHRHSCPSNEKRAALHVRYLVKFCFHLTKWQSSAILNEGFPWFCSVVWQMPTYNTQRRGTARALPFIVLLYVLFVCKCVLYYSPRVSTKLQLSNILISINDFQYYRLEVRRCCWKHCRNTCFMCRKLEFLL
jgi:hypothetical protein